MKIIFQIYLFIVIPLSLSGQYFLEFHAVADDSFREWEIILEKDSVEVEGNLRLTWGIDNDWTAWQYSIDDLDGDIVQKFKNNPGFWELRSDTRTVTINQVWPGDPSEWKISTGGRKYTIRTVYSNQLDEWALVEPKFGELIIYTETQGDPRDWIVSDYTIEEISFEERMASLFIALFTSIPKY